MSPLKKEQLAQIRDERKSQIQQAALKLFARSGFAGTKTSMIAAEAGVSEGLIYRYFTSKDELFTSIVRELMEEGQRETGNVPSLPGTPYEQIKALTENMLSENKLAFMLILRAIRSFNVIPKDAADILKEHSADAMIAPLIPLFKQGQEAGELAEGDPQELLHRYFHIVNALIIEEVDENPYGMPSSDMLMKMLKR
ncbi:TetR/AcrR family transcriptional regulator [Paenibacillus dokdonensis]|uniref:TetR/AcrR family transcriptional regulator n=1 Tax=Paenibacillus dokdonensis TaxID=2567944 RepID=UPI0010A7C8A0|nr:TetR/AcrR family transcriptional regulator [Paenibacillus dokdonensis]